jgi:hypothetical protein
MKEKMNRVIIIKNEGGNIEVFSDKKVEIHTFDFEDLQYGGEFQYPSVFKSAKLTKTLYNELLEDVASYDPYVGE